MKLFIVIFSLTSIVCFGQSNETIYLWPDQVPNEFRPKNDPTVLPNRGDGVTRITAISNPRLEVFQPESENHNGIAVLVCPGGGYKYLTANKEGSEIALWLNVLGFTAFVLEYRVPENQLGALNDIQRAMKIIRSRSESLNIDANNIGVMGFSAGGSLCARLATNYDVNTYDKQDAIDELSSKPNFSVLIYPAYLDLGVDNTLTPELSMKKDMSPFFIFGTADDKYGNSSLVMTQALRNAKVPVELHFLPEGGHGYGMRVGNIAAETWPLLLEKWFVKYPLKVNE